MKIGAKAVKNLGHNVLLTQAELDCYCLALRFKRRDLVREIFNVCTPLKYLSRLRLSWCRRPFSALLQCVLIAALLPVLLLWQLLQCLYRLLLLPLQYLMTFRLPRDLAAPGEKNMAGIHNAFSHYFHFPATVYVECFDGWVEILYGVEQREKYSLAAQLEAERLRCATGGGNIHCAEGEDYIRAFLGHARERLTRSLGHYLRES